MTKAPGFHAAFDTNDQSLGFASNFLLNVYKLTLWSSSLFDRGPLQVDPPTLDKDYPVGIQ